MKDTLLTDDTVFVFDEGLSEQDINDLLVSMKKKGNKSFTYSEAGSTSKKAYDIEELKYFFGIPGVFEFMKTNGAVHLGDRDKMDSVRSIRNNPKEKMTVVEAAAYIGFSEKTVRKLIKSGELPAQKEGIRIFLKLSDLNDYLKS